MKKMFRGGVHPHDYKELSRDCPIEVAEVPKLITVPLQQHIGAPAKACVVPGQSVKRGTVIGEAGSFVSAVVHSPVSGVVKRIEKIVHPMGMKCEGIVIENDMQDEWEEGCNVELDETKEFTSDDIKAAVMWAGIVGMGGATFPTHVKLSPPPEKKIDTVILNGVECEPFLTADDRLMLESPKSICIGLKLLMKQLGATTGYIGIEENKPAAFAAIDKTLKEMGGFAQAKLLRVMYPQGAEKQLIVACTGKEVPSGGLPMDAGVCVNNVASAHAIYEAVYLRRPLTERIVTVTGDGVQKPANYLARIGTPASALLALSGYDEVATNKLIYGGPMMGAAHFDIEMPVNKGMSGILALTNQKAFNYSPCTRCGRCVDTCPISLIPSELSILGELGKYLDTKSCNILDCIECGCCSYICPSRRPIVQWIKVSKGELAKERAKELAAKK